VIGGTVDNLLCGPDGAAKYVSGRGQDARGTNASELPATASDREETQLHSQNFLDCVRTRKQPNCPFEVGFRPAIACQMAVASYRQGLTMHWDLEREEIL
jgi:hypothetical protein